MPYPTRARAVTALLGVVLGVCLAPVRALELSDLKLDPGEADLKSMYDGAKVKQDPVAVQVPAPVQGPAPAPAPEKGQGQKMLEERRTYPANEEERREWLRKLLNPPKEERQHPGYLFGEQWDSAAGGAFRPVYGVVEGMSDRLYQMLRLGLRFPLFPKSITDKMGDPDKKDSFEDFDRLFHEKELRYLQRMVDNYPLRDRMRDPNRATGNYDERALEDWREWAKDEQISVLIDSFKDTMINRYKANDLGKAAEAHARDKRHWTDPKFLAVGGVIGGAFLYFNGLHLTQDIGDFKLGVDLSAGHRLRGAVQDRGTANRAGGAELSYKINQDMSVAVKSDVGIKQGALESEYTGAWFRMRF